MDVNIFKIWILNKLVKIPVPDKIPRLGEAAKIINCFVVYFKAKDNSWTFLLHEVHKNGIKGRYWVQSEEEYKSVCIPFDLLGEYNLEINHFYGAYYLKYDSLVKYFFYDFIPIFKIEILFERIGVFFFKQKRLVQTDRINALKLILEETIKLPNFEFGYVSIMTKLHTDKWVFHSDRKIQMRYVRLLLNSLADSGDLIQINGNYRLSPHALVTIENYEKEMEKHNQNLE